MAANDTTRGIKTSGIKTMKAGLEQYVKEVKKAVSKALDKKDYKADLDKAIQGDKSQANFNAMIAEIIKNENEVVDRLNRWITYLEGLEKIYTDQEDKFDFK